MANLTPDESEELAIDLAVAKEIIEAAGNGIPEVLQRVIQWAIKQGVQSPVENTLPPINPHRAAHRVGSPSRIDTDPDLTAFIRARIDRLTFNEIATEIAAQFPPERRASVSGLHRWFHRQRRQAAAK